jgi:predicted Zn-dependent protease
VLHADILQNRHDFIAALRLLDRAVDRDPLAIRARLMRATVRLVRGEPIEARTDCAAIFSYGESTLGSVCLAQVLAARGELEHATELVGVVHARATPPPDIEAWIQGTLADFAMRAGDAHAAEMHLRAALESHPQDETLRIQLADLLLARRDALEALRLVDLPKPTIGLLVRRYLAQTELRDPGRVETLARVRELIDLEARRNERTHLREEALLALGTGASAPETLELARANFALQREAIDVRLYARAAADAGDTRALRELNDWCAHTGFRDRMVQTLLSREKV